ncbi:hypothetical protein GCM10023088_29940 [Actinomadura verrucosospora]
MASSPSSLTSASAVSLRSAWPEGVLRARNDAMSIGWKLAAEPDGGDRTAAAGEPLETVAGRARVRVDGVPGTE